MIDLQVRIRIVAGISLAWLLLSKFISPHTNGFLVVLHAVIVSSFCVYLLIRGPRPSFEAGRTSYVLYCLGFLFWAVSDLFWGINYFIKNAGGKTLMAIFGVSGLCSTAFVLLSAAILSSVVNVESFFKARLRITYLSILTTACLYFALFYTRISGHSTFEFHECFSAIEYFAISSEFVLMTLAVLIFISARTLDWTLLAVGIICVVLGDSAIRVDKLLKYNETFTVNSLLVTTGLYSALIAFSAEIVPKRKIESMDLTSTFIRSKTSALFFCALFGILVTILSENSLIIPLLCPTFGALLFFSAFDSRKFETQDSLLKAKTLALVEQKENQAKRELALFVQVQKQIQHDIDPPLDTISQIAKEMDDSEARHLIRSAHHRISQMIHMPFRKFKRFSEISECINENEFLMSEDEKIVRNDVPILHVLESIVEEKRVRHRSKRNVSIDFEQPNDSSTFFIRANENDLARAISNLIDNSVKHVEKGFVKVALEGNLDTIIIRVLDNGKGIPADIIPRLGKKGEAHGDKAGSGLGLHQVFTFLEQCGGRILIKSELGKGTAIQLSFPKQDTPSWYIPHIEIRDGMKIIIVDDDLHSHELWKLRFAPFGQMLNRLEVYSYFTDSEFETALEGGQLAGDRLILMDYDLFDSKNDGLELIRKHGLNKESILVTGHYYDDALREQCSLYGISILQKKIKAIEVKCEEVQLSVSENRDFTGITHVLIDNDWMVRKSWEKAAKKKDISLAIFESVGEFLEVSDQFQRSVEIFVDSHLENGLRGEIEAKKIHDLGFNNITISTAIHKRILKPQYVKNVISKNPPWVSRRKEVYGSV